MLFPTLIFACTFHLDIYYVYAMPNSRFHFAISADSCVHKRHFVNSATHESLLWIQPESVKWSQLNSGNSI